MKIYVEDTLFGVCMNISDIVRESSEYIENVKELIKLLVEVDSVINSSGNGLKYRVPGFYEIYSYNDVFVFGDLHGDLDALTLFFEKLGLMDKLENENVKLVFLGDYVDRGDKQLETITTLLILKKLYPDKIILLRGNHEPAPILEPVPHDFPIILNTKYGYEIGNKVYWIFLKIFNRLPYGARIPGKILMLHGGPPTKVLEAKSFEEAFSIGLPIVNDAVLEEILWNDPYETETYESSYRGAGFLYGSRVTKRALELANVKFIVRSHEPVHGFKLDHDGKVITVFSSLNVYRLYKVGYIHINQDSQLNSPNEIVRII